MTIPVAVPNAEDLVEIEPHQDTARRQPGRLLLLCLGAIVFLFPFYYMVVGSFQEEADKSAARDVPRPANMTLHNYAQINESIDATRGLLNSAIFTGGVLLGTVVFGLLAGYALAQLEFRGKATIFSAMLLVQIVPFQLLMIPLYVLIVRTYGLGDSYWGMILPFAINSTAVFIFRQFFLQIPRELFEAARIDGASELRLLSRIAIPLARPAILTALLITFIGPWNEFLWPFLVTKKQEMQPFAVSLANYMQNVAARADNPDGAILAGGGAARRPRGRAVRRLPEALHVRRARFRRQGVGPRTDLRSEDDPRSGLMRARCRILGVEEHLGSTAQGMASRPGASCQPGTVTRSPAACPNATGTWSYVWPTRTWVPPVRSCSVEERRTMMDGHVGPVELPGSRERNGGGPRASPASRCTPSTATSARWMRRAPRSGPARSSWIPAHGSSGARSCCQQPASSGSTGTRRRSTSIGPRTRSRGSPELGEDSTWSR